MRLCGRVDRRYLAAGLAAAILACGTGSAFAATRTWTGTGSDPNWTTAANWGGTTPATGDDLVFPGGAAQPINNNDFEAGTSFNSISFTGASGGYVLNGNDVHLVGGISAANTDGDNTVWVAIQLTASQAFACTIPSASGRLFIRGCIDLGANTLTLAPGSGSVVQVSGPIAGTGGVTMTGTGGLAILFGTSTYTGPTSVQGGTLLPSNLAGGGPVTVMTGATIQLANDCPVGALTVDDGGAVESEGGGTNQVGHAVSLSAQPGSDLRLAMNSATEYGRLVVSGTVTLDKATLTTLWTFSSAPGDAFTIIDNTGAGVITGTFNALPEGATFKANGRSYRITYAGGDGNDVVITDVTEP